MKATTKVGQFDYDDEETSDELPHVLLPAMYVRGVKGTYGTIMDNCSTDKYIVNDIARKHKLKSVLRSSS